LSDLKLPENSNSEDGINVPMELYEEACVTDAKRGVEVRDQMELKKKR